MELDSIFNTEKSCILIGEAASGKTKLLELLCKCYQSEPINEACEIVSIFPESFTIESLYGKFEGRDWIEGIVANNLRNLMNQEHNIGFSFLHFDGPLEAFWVEKLQYALKSSKKFMIPNGDFVSME